jgi:drug/metabolite transporter (DMT)-like permease
LGVLYGLAAAGLWGFGDFLISGLTRRVGTRRAVAYTQVISLLSWTCLLTLVLTGAPLLGGFGDGAASAGTRVWLIALAAGVCHVAGLMLTYRAFEIGTLSLVSPIASGFAIVTAVLALLSGERPTAWALLGALLLCVGVMFATRAAAADASTTAGDATPAGKRAGVPEALGSALAFGVMFWLFDYVTPALGVEAPLVLLKTLATISALFPLLLSHRRRSPLAEPAPEPLTTVWPLAAGVALTDTLAWVAFVLGTRTQFTTVVTALASLFSAVTVLLAWVWLRERLSAPQWVGVGVILLGVLLVSL